MVEVVKGEPIGAPYKWTDIRGFGWKWNSLDALIKTWATTIQIHYTMTSTEGLIILDTFGNHVYVSPVESIIATDEISFQVSTMLTEFFNVADEIAITDFVKMFTENISASDDHSSEVGKMLSESIGSLSDGVQVSITKRLAEALTINDDIETLKTFIRNFFESIGVSELSTKDVSIAKQEAFSLEEMFSTGLIKTYFESFGISESFDHVWKIYVDVLESLELIDNYSKNVAKEISEDISIVDSIDKDVVKILADNLGVVDDIATIISFSRIFEESIDVQSAILKTVELSIEEKFSILEDFIRGGGGNVMSDLRVLAVAISDSEFEELVNQTSPTGYGAFVPFINGDYEYQESLYKVVMRSRDKGRPNIKQLRYEVDLPDLFDNGAQYIPNARTRIDFFQNQPSKSFNPLNPPSLTVAVKGGTTNFVPSVDFDIDPSHKFFEVELRNPSTNTLVDGNITWKAQGY